MNRNSTVRVLCEHQNYNLYAAVSAVAGLEGGLYFLT